jgi:isopentenyl-diphosphate Delta-isomerase
LHQAAPELDLDAVDTGLTLFGKQLQRPLLISSMTGGTEKARAINRVLAEAAQETGMAMGLGSQRAAIEDPSLADTYRVRDVAPDILLFANLGAVQLNYGYGVEQCQQAVDMIEADALILHLNALQEAVQPEGDGNFAGLLRQIETVCRQLPVPVIAKEVGWGFSGQAARQLVEAGVAAIDVAGAGGTSWSQVEMHRAPTARLARVAGAFIDWGIPTAVSIQLVRHAAHSCPSLPVAASATASTSPRRLPWGRRSAGWPATSCALPTRPASPGWSSWPRRSPTNCVLPCLQPEPETCRRWRRRRLYRHFDELLAEAP